MLATGAVMTVPVPRSSEALNCIVTVPVPTGTQAPLKVPLPVPDNFGGGSPFEKEAVTGAERPDAGTPQLSATLTCKLTGWPAVTLKPPSSEVIRVTKDEGGSSPATSLPAARSGTRRLPHKTTPRPARGRIQS